jgi:hypothetical protein
MANWPNMVTIRTIRWWQWVPFVAERRPQQLEHAQQCLVLGPYPSVGKAVVEQLEHVVEAALQQPHRAHRYPGLSPL